MTRTLHVFGIIALIVISLHFAVDTGVTLTDHVHLSHHAPAVASCYINCPGR